MPKIKILPQNKSIEVNGKDDLFSELKSQGFHINSTCGGCASCARCIITIVEGAENLNDIPFEEKKLLGNVFHITRERLSCQTRASGPVTIDISMHKQPEKTPSKKASNVKRRSREEVSKIHEERRENRKEKPKKLGGGKRPRAFDYREEDAQEYDKQENLDKNEKNKKD